MKQQKNGTTDQEKIMQWIKIEDQLPSVGEIILAYSPTLENCHGQNIFFDRMGENKKFMTPKVTHWMSRPKPPEEELKCPLCSLKASYGKCSASYEKICCDNCYITMARLTKNFDYAETKQELINRWKRLGGGK